MINNKYTFIGGILLVASYCFNFAFASAPVSNWRSAVALIEQEKGASGEDVIQELDRIFPYLGFGLANYIEQNNATNVEDVFTDIRKFNCPCARLNDVSRLKQAIFQSKDYILKEQDLKKNTIGNRMRVALVQEFLKFWNSNSGLSLGESLGQFKEEFPFLQCMVAPINCGDYTASFKVGNAMPFPNILDPNAHKHKEAITGLDWGTAANRIEMIRHTIQAINFLQKIWVHCELCGHVPPLIGDRKYQDLFFIDFCNLYHDERHLSLGFSELFYCDLILTALKDQADFFKCYLFGAWTIRGELLGHVETIMKYTGSCVVKLLPKTLWNKAFELAKQQSIEVTRKKVDTLAETYRFFYYKSEELDAIKDIFCKLTENFFDYCMSGPFASWLMVNSGLKKGDGDRFLSTYPEMEGKATRDICRFAQEEAEENPPTSEEEKTFKDFERDLLLLASKSKLELTQQQQQEEPSKVLRKGLLLSVSKPELKLFGRDVSKELLNHVVLFVQYVEERMVDVIPSAYWGNALKITEEQVVKVTGEKVDIAAKGQCSQYSEEGLSQMKDMLLKRAKDMFDDCIQHPFKPWDTIVFGLQGTFIGKFQKTYPVAEGASTKDMVESARKETEGNLPTSEEEKAFEAFKRDLLLFASKSKLKLTQQQQTPKQKRSEILKKDSSKSASKWQLK
ncbi:MAG: hypothetical protein LBS71_02060 [Puniceicoccales bacterium]|jgi:hypothetical protein|nr:hypothetical protein [Puniceicoccales bacterium]